MKGRVNMRKLDKKGTGKTKILTILAVGFLWIFLTVPTFIHVSVAANEAQALTQMQKLTQACENFKAVHGQYPNDAERLTDFIKEDLTSPGYHYQYEFLNAHSFVLVALPDNSLTGKNSFYSDNDVKVTKMINTDKIPLIIEGKKKHISLSDLKKIIREKHKIDKIPYSVAMDKTKVSITIVNEPVGIDRENKGGIKKEVNVALLKVDKISERIRDIKQGNVSEQAYRLPVLADVAKNPAYEFEFFVRDLEGVSYPPPNTVAIASNDNMTRSDNLLVQKVIRNTLFYSAKQDRMDSSIARTISNTATPVMAINSSIGNPVSAGTGAVSSSPPSSPSGGISSSGAVGGSGGDGGGIRQRIRSGRR